jgi:hypothetical protein
VLSNLKDEPNVYALAFHVDYWNGSWTDRFATAAITERQRGYARTLGSGTYTPELVIHGRTHVLGSEEDSARREIAATSAEAVHLTLDAKWNDEVTVTWTLDRVVASTELVIAITEDGIVVTPNAGENAGETLQHDAVVRAFVVTTPTTTGTRILQLPADARKAKCKVVAFVQRPSGEVLAASGSPASPKPSSPR